MSQSGGSGGTPKGRLPDDRVDGDGADRGVDEGADLFRQAVADARPLAGRERVRRAPEAKAVPVPAGPSEPRLAVTLTGDRVSARAPGVTRRQLRALASEQFPPAARVDLHGLRVAAARAAVDSRIADAKRAGLRAMLVVHGKGTGAVREAAVSALLANAEVQGFVTAHSRHGGDGALYVLLKKGS